MSGHPYRRHGRLFWKVFLHGVLLLAIIVGSVAVAGWLFGRTPAWRKYPERLATYLSARSMELEHPAQIERDLRREQELLGVEASVYRLDGSLVASNIEPPIPPLSAEDVLRLERRPHHPGGGMFALPVRSGEQVVAYVSVRGLPLSHHLSRMLAGLLSVVVALTFVSFLTARFITRPMEQLTAAAERLGSGDLSARVGLKRKDEVGALGYAFDEMADRLQKMVLGEKELLANVSHELRTPIARIKVALELAAEGDAEKVRRYLGDIAQDLGDLEKLVESVLAVARLDLMGPRDGAPPLRKTRLPARQILDSAAERFRVAHPERTLELAIGDGLPEIDGDEAMLKRVLDNLLDNARKYSDPSKPVRVQAAARDGLTVEVIDEGIGIEPADLEVLFRPFFRTERSRSRGTGGIGLGLTFAKKVVEAHGGTIAASSTPGKGTTIVFRLPPAA